MVTKKKICAGFDSISHEAYIYKNIDGKKYCKSCAYKLQPKKPIKKMSEKGKFKINIKKDLFEKDKAFYMEVWFNRFFAFNKNIPNSYIMVRSPKCENPLCNRALPTEPNLMFFHHILEKRNYPEYRHLEENIAILCPDCHNMYETYPDKIPHLVARKKLTLDKLNKIKDEEQ